MVTGRAERRWGLDLREAVAPIMAGVPTQLGPFEDVSIYDAPMLLASQAIEGEFSPRTAANTLFSPSRLSITERTGVAQRLKQATGQNALSNAFIDVALNPWVWFFAATTPLGVSSLGRGGQALFRQARGTAAYVRKFAPPLKFLSTFADRFNGTALPAVAVQAAHEMESVNRTFADEVDIGYSLLVNSAREKGIKLTDAGLDASRYINSKTRAWVDETNRLLFAYLKGAGENWVERIPVAVKKYYEKVPGGLKEIGYEDWKKLGDEAKATETKLDVQEVLHRAEFDSQDAIATALHDRGALFYAEGVRRGQKKTFQQVLGDPEAKLRLYRYLTNPATVGREGVDSSTAMGLDLVKSIMGDVAAQVGGGRMSKQEFMQLLDETQNAVLNNKYYVPRNTSVTYGIKDGRMGLVDPSELRGVHEVARMRGTGRGVSRTTGAPIYAPDEMEAMAEAVERLTGARRTEALTEHIAQGRAALDEVLQGGDATVGKRLLSTDIQEATVKYLREMRGAAVLTAKPSSEVLHAQKLSREYIGDALDLSDPRYDKSLGGTQADMRTAIADISPEHAPAGGFSLSDVIQGDYLFLKGNEADRKFVSDVFVPRVLGRVGVNQAATLMSMENGKQLAGWFADSFVGKTAEKFGPGAKQFVEDLRAFSQTKGNADAVGWTSRSLANYLYVTHLGLNAGSFTMQSMQPMLHLAAWVGVPNVVKAYGPALEDIANYVKMRIRHSGLSSISELNRQAMMEKTISTFVDGEDIIGLKKSFIDPLEGHVAGSGTSPLHPPEGTSLVFQWMMKGFEKAELLNRLVSAHAVANLYRTAKNMPEATFADLARKVPGFKTAVRDATEKAQFVPQWWNQPEILNTHFKNPLIKQFLSFPLRATTGIVQGGAYGGKRQWAWGGDIPLPNAVVDFGRLMGISAIIHEVGKNLVGADLQRGLGYAAVTDVLPFMSGGRYDEREAPVPIPPAADIIFSASKWLATGDKALLQQTLPRLVPGGIAISRAMGALPQVPLAGLGLQKTYAGWDQQTEDGRVPIFKSDGTLVDYRTPASIVMRGLGADLGRWQSEGELDKFLINNREDMVAARGEYMKALLANNIAGAKAVAQGFQGRFGVPLTVTKQQLRAAQQSRVTTKPEKLVDMLPKEVRPVYAQLVQSGRVNVPAAQLVAQPSAKRRNPYREGVVKLAPETIQYLQQQAAEAEARKLPTQADPLPSFAGY